MSQDTSPISFAISVARLPQRGTSLTIEADSDQREALAAQHDLLEVKRFHADMIATPWKKGGVKVTGRVRAEVVQSCIVTLDPVDGVVDEEVSALFLPEGSKLALPRRGTDGEILLDAEGDDGPELFSGDSIDVGQLVEEFFALGLDPYPRKAGVSLPGSGLDTDATPGPLGEKLLELRKKL
jgi:uncharacterized metal-binding protein YceD (DUF177 family)